MQGGNMEVENEGDGALGGPLVADPQAQPAVKPYKRKVVDEYGNEVPDSKRNRAVPDNKLKMNIFKFILHWHEYLRASFQIARRDNLDDIADITAIVQTIHTKFRQDMNGVGAMKDKITDTFKLTAAGKTITFGLVKAHMKNLIEDLVQCDKCDRWFHFGCAKLDKLPESTDPWLCIQCEADHMEMLQLKKELMAIQTELGARAKAQKGAELHATSLERELDNVKQELENKEKEEDTRQDILKGIANVLQSSRKVSDPGISAASTPSAVSEARAISIMMKRQIPTLPTFSGEAREWPAFKRRFIETSQSGEYTDSENLIRLQQALNGKAARSVQALMLDPSNVQQIIDRLEKQFGQFRKIHRELREEIERIRPSGLGTIIEITDALENLVSHLTAMKQEEYLRDPRLMDDIALKLPYEQQIKWMEFNYTAAKTVTLKDLLQFLKPRADIQREMTRQPFERRNRINKVQVVLQIDQ